MVDSTLVEARKRKQAKEDERRAAAEAAELERLLLEEKLEKELGGPAGSMFAIVDVSELGEGCIAVKLGEDVHYATYKESKMNVVDTETFVLPNVVHPSKDDYRKIVARRPAIADRCALALAELYGIKLAVTAGK